MTDEVKAAIVRAEMFESKLPQETLDLPGYSGRKGRHFLNNLAAAFSPYVEVGCFQGSTLICAAYKNDGPVIGIDNFTDETKPGVYMVDTRRALLLAMLDHSHLSRPSLIDASCWDVKLAGVSCCFFDGAHSEQDHVDSVVRLYDWFRSEFVLVVDDFNRKNVRIGTEKGIEQCKLRVLFRTHLGAEAVDDSIGWWNGFGVYVLSK